MNNDQIFIHVSPVSGNIKTGPITGPITVTTTSKNTYPNSCQFPVLGDTTTADVNRRIIKHINHKGFVVNLCANNIEEADSMADLGIAPVVTILPIDAGKSMITPGGRKVITCPATYKDGVTCASCKLCAEQRLLKNGKERVIIGFPAHGVSKKKTEKVFMMKREG